MIKLKECIIVEGKYDKIKLECIFDAVIFVTNGFDIFRDERRMDMICSTAEKNGVVILTDSDWAGFEIRHKLVSCLPDAKVYNAYVPDVFGKERRKSEPSREGKLGVEGLDAETIINAVSDSGVVFCGREQAKNAPGERAVTKTDLFTDGLSGSENSGERLRRFKELCGLPEHISKTPCLII